MLLIERTPEEGLEPPTRHFTVSPRRRNLPRISTSGPQVWAPPAVGRRGERTHLRCISGDAVYRRPGHPAGEPVPEKAGHAGPGRVRRPGCAIVEQSSGRAGRNGRARLSGPCQYLTYGAPEEGLEPPTR